VNGSVPVAPTLSVAVNPNAIVALCGSVTMVGGRAIVIVALAESTVPAVLVTRTQ
jgi:hypothetical protein